VEIDWETLTGGADGAALADSIREFVHERFQHIPLPRLIRSVKCHGFQFGTVAPEVVLKDICDPLPDFYENTEENEEPQVDGENGPPKSEHVAEHIRHTASAARGTGISRRSSRVEALGKSDGPALSRGATPGILGGTSNLGYFHLPLSAGLSGTATPLAAVAGARFPQGAQPSVNQHHHSESFSSISPPPTATPPSRPTSRDTGSYFDQRRERDHETSPEDLQVVFHVTYSGDVKLSLTADVFLDYPMPSFVGIPLKLNITGLTFNGVGILAYIKKRAHLCFLAPEDAEALIGGEAALESPDEGPATAGDTKPTKLGALLEDIKIESEMGETDSGKQVLKNVGKIEKFVLEQVQRIFEDEFVYPSYWTFLV
jgi:mitochondrial distribution and morphology protein 12